MFLNNSVKLLLIGNIRTTEKSLDDVLRGFNSELVIASSSELMSPNFIVTGDFAAIVVDVDSSMIAELEIAQLIRSKDNLRSVPIIFLNNNLDVDDLYSIDNIDVVPRSSLKALRSKLAVYLDLYSKTAEIVQLRKRADEASESKNKSANLFLENIKDYALVTMDLDRNITEWLGDAEKITGWTSKEIVGQKIDVMFTAEDRAVGQPVIEADSALDTGRAEDRRWHLRKDGTRFFADGVMVPLKQADGEVLGLAKIFRDSTQRKTSESELQRSKDLFALLLESSGEGIYGVDLEGKCIFLNKTGEYILGYSSEELIGKSIYSLTGRSKVNATKSLVDQNLIATAVETGKSIRVDDKIFLRKDGTEIPVVYSVSPIVVNGKPYGGVITFADDSLHRHDKEQLKASEDRYRTLFNSIDEGFALIEMIFDSSGTPVDYLFLDVNPTFENQTGLVNAVGKTACELVPDLESHWFEIYGNVARTGEPTRFIEGSDSMGRWFSVYATRVGGDSSKKVVLLFSDISDRKRSEAERERLLSTVQIAHDQMADIFRQAPAFMCTLRGPHHVFDMVNERYLQLVGWRELAGKTVSEALPEVIDQGYIQILDDVFNTGKPFVGKDASVRLQRSVDGEPEERTIDFVYLPLKDVDGKISGILVHGIDITERKRAEEDLRRLALDLSEADRRKTEFLATLAHELRNPLAPIQNGLEVMKYAKSDPAALERTREIMQRQISHMVHLINDLLDIARITSGKVELKKQRVTLESVVKSAVETIMPLIELNHHQLTVQIPPQEIMLDIDPARLSQVISNLLTNAAKYTKNGGRIALNAEVINGQMELTITDNGVGIPSDQLQSIFEMFTQVGRNMSLAQGGLGIGLSLVKHMVEMHGGTVHALSDGTGHGSTFTIRLPLAEQEIFSLHDPESRNSQREQITKSLTILVADDNEDAALTLAALLEINEHVTHVVHDGLNALKAAENIKPDVAFLDIGMPELTGYEVAAEIKKIPELADTFLIALTGWGTEDDRKKSRTAGFDYHLTKPAAFTEVQEILNKIITAKR